MSVVLRTRLDEHSVSAVSARSLPAVGIAIGSLQPQRGRIVHERGMPLGAFTMRAGVG